MHCKHMKNGLATFKAYAWQHPTLIASYIKWNCQDIKLQWFHSSWSSVILSHHLLLQRNIISPMVSYRNQGGKFKSKKSFSWAMSVYYNRWLDFPHSWTPSSLLSFYNHFQIVTWYLRFFMTPKNYSDLLYSIWEPLSSTHFKFLSFWEITQLHSTNDVEIHYQPHDVEMKLVKYMTWNLWHGTLFWQKFVLEHFLHLILTLKRVYGECGSLPMSFHLFILI